jgi:hypothetical protein
MNRIYFVLVCESKAGLREVADREGLTLDGNTIKMFNELSTETDGTLGNVGMISTARRGIVALAWRDA